MAAAEKLLVDYLRRHCPKHVEYFAAGETAIRPYCHQCAEAYEVLGLWRGEGNQQIKVAYRELAKKWHPDTFSETGDVLRQEAEEHFKVICGAYKHLMSHT